ncbi:MAG: hypothetical protein QOF27_27, partial [Gaiellaceae bacterium]|nr:hypothetical protein [Gaiellaceae bacterium]
MFEQPGILPTEPIPNRSRRPAGKGEQLQEDSHRPDSVPKRGPAGFAPSASRRAHVLVVRRHVREDRIPCVRRCEAQRRGLPGNSDVTGCASPTSNRLRGRPVAATASGGRSPSWLTALLTLKPRPPPPRLSLLYGSCRYGPTTSQKTLKSLRRSGCGPCRSDNVSEMKSPTGLFGSPVYLKTSTAVKIPASR